MEELGIRISWRERHIGSLGRTELTADIPDAAAFLAGPNREARLVGRVRGEPVGDALLRDGRVKLDGGALRYEATIDAGSREVHLRAHRTAGPSDSLAERLTSLRRLHLELRDAASGDLVGKEALDPASVRSASPLPLPIVTNAPSTWRSIATAVAFERLMASELAVRSVS
jgi:hypothetical protein